MIVLDASVVVELLINGALADSLRNDLAGRNESIIVPHLPDVEVLSAFRKLAAQRRIDAHRSAELLAGLAALPAERYPHTHDAIYIALAEATGSVLYTSDEKLRKGHRAQVMLFTN